MYSMYEKGYGQFAVGIYNFNKTIYSNGNEKVRKWWSEFFLSINTDMNECYDLRTTALSFPWTEIDLEWIVLKVERFIDVV